jgi:hypothetical protein
MALNTLFPTTGDTFMYDGLDPHRTATEFIRIIGDRIVFQLGPIPVGTTVQTQDETHGNHDVDNSTYKRRKIALIATWLCGPARKWYDTLLAAATVTYEAFELAFITQFTTAHLRFQAQAKLQCTKQGPEESARQFYLRVRQLAEQAWQTKPQDVRDHLVRQSYLTGLRNDLRKIGNKEVIRNDGIAINDLLLRIEQAELADTLHSSEKELQRDTGQTNVNAIEIEDSDNRSELSNIIQALSEHLNLDTDVNVATTTPDNPRKTNGFRKFCNGCRRSGHSISQCTNPRYSPKKTPDPDATKKQTYPQLFRPQTNRRFLIPKVIEPQNPNLARGEPLPQQYQPQRSRDGWEKHSWSTPNPGYRYPQHYITPGNVSQHINYDRNTNVPGKTGFPYRYPYDQRFTKPPGLTRRMDFQVRPPNPGYGYVRPPNPGYGNIRPYNPGYSNVRNQNPQEQPKTTNTNVVDAESIEQIYNETNDADCLDNGCNHIHNIIGQIQNMDESNEPQIDNSQNPEPMEQFELDDDRFDLVEMDDQGNLNHLN